MQALLRVSIVLLATMLMSGCITEASSLTPKNVVQADVEQVPRHLHYEYQSYCGKPCTPIIVRWQLSGIYSVQQGDAAAISGKMEPAQVQLLASLYGELQTLTLSMPKDLTRAHICKQYATDHAVKIFSTPATVDGWRFKDNHGCRGFDNAEQLRSLEAKIEAALPSAASDMPPRQEME